MSPRMKILLAHPKDSPEGQLRYWKTAVERWLQADDVPADVVTGVDDYNENIALEGAIDAWARGLSSRRDSYTGKPTYAAFVATGETIGKATAVMLAEALRVGVPVYCLREQGHDVTVFEAANVTEDDSENYRGGWRVV